jgi:DNA recombination protein RmuC
MDITIVLIVLALLVLQGIVFWFIFSRNAKSEGGQDTQSMLLLQSQLAELSRVMENKLGEGTNRMFDSMKTQFDQSQRLMSDITRQVSDQLVEVTKGVTQTQESTKQVFVIAEQLQNLEKVLKNQKQRGNLGEASLELILGNILPPTAFQMQYEFPGGETVDAIVRTKEGIIPVDAKFPLENYMRLLDEKDDARRAEHEDAFKRDLKKRIDETSKYIRPKDDTLPFAFMYIPAESIYYDLLTGGVGAVNARNLIDYAYNEKKVIIVSPTTFAAYLQSVLYGFKAFKIEEQAKDIAKNVEALGRHIGAYEEFYKKLGTSLSTTVNHWNAGQKELGKIDKDVFRITGDTIGIESQLLDKPLIEGKE